MPSAIPTVGWLPIYFNHKVLLPTSPNRSQRVQAYIVLNLTADLRSEFSWNTKQLFVYVVSAACFLAGVRTSAGLRIGPAANRQLACASCCCCAGPSSSPFLTLESQNVEFATRKNAHNNMVMWSAIIEDKVSTGCHCTWLLRTQGATSCCCRHPSEA